MNTFILYIFFILLLHPFAERKDQGSSKINADLSWLKDPILFSEILSPDHWEKDPKIKFDKNGVPLVNNQINPVTISQYALSCFAMYHKTDSVSYLEKFSCIAEYLMDTSSFKKIGADRHGYPYKAAWRDMKAGWYSGLAQAEVIGVLIRYYSVTGKKSVLPFITHAKNLMLSPVDSGGTLGKSPEGKIWIEEYPGSKQNPQVLNGFLISTAFLHEYCNLFKEDFHAKNLLDSCYQSIKLSAHHYDSGTGLYYARAGKSNVNNWYMKAQVIEALQLYKLSKDKFFLNLYALWSTYTYNKPVNFTGCSFNETNFSSPSSPEKEGWMNAFPSYKDLLLNDLMDTAWITGEKRYDIVKKLFDRNPSTLHTFDLKKDSSGIFSVTVKLRKNIRCNAISIGLPADSIPVSNIEFFAKNSGGKLQSVSLFERKIINKTTYFFFAEKDIREFNLAITIPKEKNVFNFSDLNLHHSSQQGLSQFCHYAAGTFSITGEKFQVRLETRDLNDYYIFYKSANGSEKELAALKYRADKTVATNKTLNSEGKYYSFMVVYKTDLPTSSIRNFKVIQ